MSIYVATPIDPTDDAYESGGAVTIYGTTMSIAGYPAGGITNGWRFPSIPFTNAVTISTVYAKWYKVAGGGKGTSYLNHYVQWEYNLNPPAFSTATNNLSSRTKDPAIGDADAVLWEGYFSDSATSFATNQSSPIGLTTQQQTDLKASLQALVSLPGWSAGNAIALFLTPRTAAGSGTLITGVYTVEHATGAFPELTFDTDQTAGYPIFGKATSFSSGSADLTEAGPVEHQAAGRGRGFGVGQASVGVPYTTESIAADADWILGCINPTTGAICIQPWGTSSNGIHPEYSMWAVIGLCQAYRATGNVSYINAAWAHVQWMQSKQSTSGLVTYYQIGVPPNYPEVSLPVGSRAEDNVLTYTVAFLIAAWACWTSNPDEAKLASIATGLARPYAGMETIRATSGAMSGLYTDTLAGVGSRALGWHNALAQVALQIGWRLCMQAGNPTAAESYRARISGHRSATLALWSGTYSTYSWSISTTTTLPSRWGQQQVPSTPSLPTDDGGEAYTAPNDRARALYRPETLTQVIYLLTGTASIADQSSMRGSIWDTPYALAESLHGYYEAATGKWWLVNGGGWADQGLLHPSWWRHWDDLWIVLPGVVLDGTKARQIVQEARQAAAAESYALPFTSGIMGQLVAVGVHSLDGTNLVPVYSGKGTGYSLGRMAAEVTTGGGGGGATLLAGGAGTALLLGRGAGAVGNPISSGRGIAYGRGRARLDGATGSAWAESSLQVANSSRQWQGASVTAIEGVTTSTSPGIYVYLSG